MSSSLSSSSSESFSENRVNPLAGGSNAGMLDEVIKRIFEEDAVKKSSVGAVGDLRPNSIFSSASNLASTWAAPSIQLNNTSLDAVITSTFESLNLGSTMSTTHHATPTSVFGSQNNDFSATPGSGRPVAPFKATGMTAGMPPAWPEVKEQMLRQESIERIISMQENVDPRRMSAPFDDTRSIYSQAVEGQKQLLERVSQLRRPNLPVNHGGNFMHSPQRNGHHFTAPLMNGNYNFEPAFGFRQRLTQTNMNLEPIGTFQSSTRFMEDNMSNMRVIRSRTQFPDPLDSLSVFIDKCLEQQKLLERERKRVEKDLSELFPDKTISGNNSIPVPKTNQGKPHRIDRLYSDLMREHTRIQALIETMELLCNDIGPPIRESMSNWLKSLQNLEKIRKFDVMAAASGNMALETLDSLSLALQELCTKTRAARTAFWCSYVSVVFQEWFPSLSLFSKKKDCPTAYSVPLLTPRGEPVIPVVLFPLRE